MNPPQDTRLLEAVLCALVVRAGGRLTLPAAEIQDCDQRYRLRTRADWGDATVTLSVQEVTLDDQTR
jgi:hypothetical protein